MSLSGTSSYNELKETFEKSTDLNFDDYVEIINNPPFQSNKRFIILIDYGIKMNK